MSKQKMGRPPTGQAMGKKFTFVLDDQRLAKLERLAAEREQTIGQVIRAMIDKEES